MRISSLALERRTADRQASTYTTNERSERRAGARPLITLNGSEAARGGLATAKKEDNGRQRVAVPNWRFFVCLFPNRRPHQDCRIIKIQTIRARTIIKAVRSPQVFARSIESLTGQGVPEPGGGMQFPQVYSHFHTLDLDAPWFGGLVQSALQELKERGIGRDARKKLKGTPHLH